jgi:4-amino-4-deoxy-L-arabinose transferase-like glycosyltransferase
MTNWTATHDRPQDAPSPLTTWLLFAAIFAAVYFASLFTPPLMDDVDASHAQAAQHVAETGNWITCQINGIRYIEKPPLPYWLVAVSYRVFGQNTFATHLPNALAMLGLAWLCWVWARRAWGPRAGLYAGLGVLTSIGPFLFTRFIIPESILSLFLLIALYGLITGLELNLPNRFYWTWACVALALLTKGFIAPVFFIGAAVPYLLLTGQWRRWRVLKPVSGLLLFLLIAAPWHILCGLANPDQGHPVGNHPTIGNVHGFFYFYFVNEHFLRFFSLRYPHDYNKLPFAAYWLLHLVWLFPWSLFLPALLVLAWRTGRQLRRHLRSDGGEAIGLYLDGSRREDVAGYLVGLTFRVRTVWLLSLFSAWTLLFFSISSNQEYYTFPVWPPLFILIAAALARIEERRGLDGSPDSGPNSLRPLLSTAWLTGAQGVFAVVGVLSAATLAWGLWDSRNLPYVADIGTLLAHRAVAGYTLSMSHFFDLTGPSFAALRLPAVLAAIALLIGPAFGWVLRIKGKQLAATVSVALTMSVFLIAAHIAFARFQPMLGSKQLADTIILKGSPADTFIIYGEHSDASSVVFYTHRFFAGKPAMMVVPRCGQHGEGTPLLWGSCYPDAPNIFLSEDQLSKVWGTGERKWLFAQEPNQQKAESLLAGRLYPVQSIADKALWTDRPLK